MGVFTPDLRCKHDKRRNFDVGNGNSQTGIQKGLLPHTGVEDFVVIFRGVEHFRVRLEGHDSAVLVRVPDDAHFLRDLATGELHLIDLALLVHLHRQPLRQSVDNGRTHAM